ncbi:hypothetical protein [Croceimicrobium sp.]|uniref:hypothetical protein n=1 Tax=Croceimicrobium sp. TaxID=2828340 RepID=UPI003BABF343
MFRILLFIALSISLQAQEMTGEQAISKVFKVLNGEEVKIPEVGKREALLQSGAWEALAYLDVRLTFQASEEDLQEAVPDYYRFKAEDLIFKLINPEDHNQYGYVGKLKYRWEKDTLVVLSADGREVKDRWQLLYLDENYLALKMDALRVFFAHTVVQES